MLALAWRVLASFLIVLGIVAAREQESLDRIKQTGKIKVVGSSDDSSHDQHFQKFCFTIGTEDKNKKKAYEHCRQKLSKVQRYFKMRELIPHESSLTEKKVEVRLNRKRRFWTTMRTVCFLSEIDQQRFIEKSLLQFGVRHFRAYPIGSLLNDRQLATKAFNNAKNAATIILEQIRYKIKKVSNIEILGNSVYQQQQLEEEIEDQFNQGEDSNEDRLSSGDQDEDQIGLPSEQLHSGRSRLQQAAPIKVSVVFQVVPEDQESSSTDENDEM